MNNDTCLSNEVATLRTLQANPHLSPKDILLLERLKMEQMLAAAANFPKVMTDDGVRPMPSNHIPRIKPPIYASPRPYIHMCSSPPNNPNLGATNSPDVRPTRPSYLKPQPLSRKPSTGYNRGDTELQTVIPDLENNCDSEIVEETPSSVVASSMVAPSSVVASTMVAPSMPLSQAGNATNNSKCGRFFSNCFRGTQVFPINSGGKFTKNKRRRLHSSHKKVRAKKSKHNKHKRSSKRHKRYTRKH